MNSSVMRRPTGSLYLPPMMDKLGCFALMLGGESQAAYMSSAISSEEVVIVSSRWPQKVGGCLALPGCGETQSGRVARRRLAHRATLATANLH